MARLKHNGTEVARLTKPGHTAEGHILRDDTQLSIRSNGWVLRKHTAVIHDMYHPKGYRAVSRGWRKYARVQVGGNFGMSKLPAIVEEFVRQGYTEVKQS